MRFNKAVAVLAVIAGLSITGKAQPAFTTNALVAYYPFNGNANDESGNGRDGVVVGSALGKDRFGNDNRSYSFNALGQHIKVANSLHPTGNAAVTYSCWVTWPDVNTYRPQFILNIGTWDGTWFANGSRSGIGFDIYGGAGAPPIATWTAQITSAAFFDTSSIAPNQWHHLVVTKGPQSVDFYVDGQPFGHQSMSITQNVTSSDLFIGSSMPSVEQFFGSLDDIRIYSRILSAPEVKALYDYEVAPFSEGLVAYYPFNGNANDESGFGNNGLVAGNAHLDVDRFGSPNRAFDFQGGSDSISVSNLSVSTATGAKTTVSFWMNWDGRFYSATDRGCVAFSFSASYHLLFQGAGPGRFGFGTGLGDVWGVNYDSSYSNRWIHVVGIFSNGSTRDNVLFVNGVKVASTMTLGGQASQGSWTDSVSKTATISGWSVNPVTYRFFGGLDDVRIYNRALSDSEVYQLYTAESGPQVALIKAVKPSFVNLIPFNNYQLQVSTDMIGWTNYGSPFTATNSTMVYPEYWDVDNWGQLFFRLLAAP